jgi:hypothetical protein
MELRLSPGWLRLGHQALLVIKEARITPQEELGMEFLHSLLIQVFILGEIEGLKGGKYAEVLREEVQGEV